MRNKPNMAPRVAGRDITVRKHSFFYPFFQLFLLVTLSLSQFSKADNYFNELRWDAYLPNDCHEITLEDFQGVEAWPVYGIEGSSRRGFDYEYPLRRDDAAWLWDAFRGGKEPTRWPSRLDKEVQTIKEHKKAMGFDFGAEGEVLELLALVDLHRNFDPERYFFTGGIEYRESPDARTIGELDVLVGDRSNCNIVLVGEAKLGNGSLTKAHHQLARFKEFLNRHNISVSWNAFELLYHIQ